MEMAARCVGQCQPRVRRVERVIDVERFVRIGEAWHTFTRLVQHPRNGNRSAHRVPLEVDWPRLDSEELSEQRTQSGYWTTGLTAGDRRQSLLLLRGRTLIGDEADRPIIFAHHIGGVCDHSEVKVVKACFVI